MIEVKNNMGFKMLINPNYIASIEEIVMYRKVDKSDPLTVCGILVAGSRDPVIVMVSYDDLMKLLKEDQEK